MSVPTGSPIDIRIILPLVFKLKTIIGSWLSRHMAMEVASMTASDLDRTSRYETSRYITAPGNCKGSLSYTPSTRVALAITSARISRARRVAAVSVEKYGFEVPPAKTQTRPFSRWRRARRRMYGSATSCISMALMTRVCTPICSKASCNDRELMTVASMPMWSAVTRSMFWAAAAMPRKILPPPTTSPICTPAAAEDIAAAHHQPDLDAGGGYRGHFRGQLIDTRGVDAESGASGQRFAAELEHDSLILRHWRRAALRRRIRSRPRRPPCTG